MIELLEIRNASRELIGIIDTAKSVIWTAKYYETGDFEIYVQATPNALALLQIGNFVTREDDRNIGIIEKIEVTVNASDGQMITASGRFAKCLLGRRLIYSINGNNCNPVISRGLVEGAMRTLVNNNAVAPADQARKIDFIELGALAGITKRIIDENGNAADKQTTYSNLLDYTDKVLKEYGLGAYMGFNRSTGKLQYNIYDGADRSAGNAEGNAPIVFSQDFDNLVSSNYSFNNAEFKNTVLIGGEGEGVERFYILLGDSSQTGINRREVFIDGADQSRSYKDESEVEQYYTDAEYTAMLATKALQGLSDYVNIETFSGEVDVTSFALKYGKDYHVGDIVTIQDNTINKYMTVRIISATEVQDDGGYTIAVEFGE